jgi:hypothetical protein
MTDKLFFSLLFLCVSIVLALTSYSMVTVAMIIQQPLVLYIGAYTVAVLLAGLSLYSLYLVYDEWEDKNT